MKSLDVIAGDVIMTAKQGKHYDFKGLVLLFQISSVLG